MHRFNSVRVFLFLCLVLLSMPLFAQLNIEIFGGGAARIPVAIVPFADENRLQQSVTSVISADLQRTGLFRMVDPGGLSPHVPQDVVYADWVSRGANALVIGRIAQLGAASLEPVRKLRGGLRRGILMVAKAARSAHSRSGLQQPSQRWPPAKDPSPGGFSWKRPAGFVARRLQTPADMLPPCASPSGRFRENRTPLSFRKGS